jgi:Na+/proline symporter
LPPDIGFTDALHIGGKMGKLNVITNGVENGRFNWNDRYNIWSGVIGGFFLALSYFGTDQSQVGRYLTAQNNKESRLGLLMNGLVKIPMQFCILLIGVLVFSFYQFYPAPLSFNTGLVRDAKQSVYKDSLLVLENKYNTIAAVKQSKAMAFSQAMKNGEEGSIATTTDALKAANDSVAFYRSEFKTLSAKISNKDTNDTNYIFFQFVKEHLPSGLKGLLIAVIFLAAWGSIAAALNSLASSTVVDFHKRYLPELSSLQEYKLSKWYTFGWGVFCILVVQFAGRLGNSLIEAVNILGSLFYGVILGIFLVAFYIKRVGGTATFYAALLTEAFVMLLFFNEQVAVFSFLPDVSFLWLIPVGVIGVVGLGLLFQKLFPPPMPLTAPS